MTAPTDFEMHTAFDSTVRVGDRLYLDAWRQVTDLRQIPGGGKAAVLHGLPGIWRLPETFSVLRMRRQT